MPSLTRRQGRWISGATIALSVIVSLLVFIVAGGLAHARDRPFALSGRLADGWALASAGLTWLLGRKRTGLMRSPELLRFVSTIAPLALFAWIQQFHGSYPEPSGGNEWRCFVLTLAIAAAPLASVLGLQRGLEPQYPSALGAAAAAACGGWASVAMLLGCPFSGPRHSLLGHVAPFACLIATGSALGTRWLGVRRIERASARRTPLGWDASSERKARAGQGSMEKLARRGPIERNDHLRAFGSAQPLEERGQRELVGRGVVDAE
jgi:hypothetical protein